MGVTVAMTSVLLRAACFSEGTYHGRRAPTQRGGRPPRRQNGPLERTVALDRHAVHDPPGAVQVVDGVMHGAAVVPEGERALAPAEAAGELRTRRRAEQELQERDRKSKRLNSSH